MRSKPIVLAAAIAILVLCLQYAAAQAARPQFEVASVKHSIDGEDSDFQVLPGGRMVAADRTVSDLIFHAYRLRPYQIPDKPEWANSEHYDIEAKADGNPTYNEMMVMLQSLLQDRFNLKVHWGTTDQPVFLITAGKGGVQLKPSTAPCVRFDQTASIQPVDEQTHLSDCRDSLFGGEQRRWIAENIGMSDVTFMLSCECLLGRKVIDMTGFTGRFDFTLEFAADPLKTDASALSLLTAFQDQLGLKVDSGRAPVEVLVVDSVSKPSEN
jgi:uncharacterized protein (TIGR03435 family)